MKIIPGEKAFAVLNDAIPKPDQDPHAEQYKQLRHHNTSPTCNTFMALEPPPTPM